jgi:hypothetical protein
MVETPLKGIAIKTAREKTMEYNTAKIHVQIYTTFRINYLMRKSNLF